MIRWTTLLLCLLVLPGCIPGLRWLFEPSGSNQPGDEGGVGASLISIGEWTLLAGGCLVIAGVLGNVLCRYPATAAIFTIVKPFATLALVLGGAAIVTGAAFVWLGVYSWLLGLVVVGFLLAVVWRNREAILRWLRIKKHTTKPPEQ